MSKNYIHIDGSLLEGGGQILRNALSLSCLLQKPVKITNIRANRSKPGLAAQHLKGVQLVRDITNAKVSGDFKGSTSLEFHPSHIKGGKYFADIGTAGSIALLLQTALPVCLFADSTIELDLKGGTNAAMAPQIDYMTEIFLPNLEIFGGSFDFDLFRRGYFPKGGGHVSIKIDPIKNLKSCNLTQFGNIKKFFGWSFVAGVLPLKIADEMTESSKQVFRENFHETPVDILSYKEDARMASGNCSGIILGAETSLGCWLGSSGLGSKNESPKDVGRNSALELVQCLSKSSCTDSYCQDQLIILMALATGQSKIKTMPMTLHTQTSIHVAETLTNVKFNVIENLDGTSTIECQGLGLENKNIK